MKKTLLIYGLFLGILAFLLKITEYWFWVKMNAFDVYAILLSVIFLGTGLWLGMGFKNKKSKQNAIPTEGVKQIDEQAIEKLGISKREYEVLVLMGKGMSNQEIADTLFVSQNTVKTHTSRLFEKLDVKNRTHAILKAKEMGIIQN
jgi:two-component system, NarL family, response regulator LiaR